MDWQTVIPLGLAIVGWILTGLGWFISHRSTLTAQKDSFRQTILNEGRIEIVKAIRAYQGWLTEIYSKVVSPPQNSAGIEEYARLLGSSASTDWIARLEEYVQLFPKTDQCRSDLVERHGKLTVEMSGIHDFKSVGDERKKRTDAATEMLLDQAALMEDLRVYIQNFSLSALFGGEIEPRKVQDHQLPRLVFDKEGNLHLHPGTEVAKDKDNEP